MHNVNTLQDIQTFRYERKYLWPYSVPTILEQKISLHPVLFTRAFPTRKVFTLYFDTPDLLFLQQNMLGQSPRSKIRLRWYELDGVTTQPHLEIKYKQSEVNTKYFFELSLKKPIMNILTDERDIQLLTAMVRDLLSTKIQQASFLQPFLINNYQRQYYLSNQTGIRVTIDSKLQFQQLSDYEKRINPSSLDFCIVEAKYDLKKDKNVDILVKDLPLRISKVSKYEIGMKLTYPQANA